MPWWTWTGMIEEKIYKHNPLIKELNWGGKRYPAAIFTHLAVFQRRRWCFIPARSKICHIQLVWDLVSHTVYWITWNGRDWCGSNFFPLFSYDPNITGHARMCYNMVTEVTRDRMRCFAHRELNWTAMFIACKRSWLFVKGEFCKIEILQNISIAGNIFFHCKPYQLFIFFCCCCFCQTCCAMCLYVVDISC